MSAVESEVKSRGNQDALRLKIREIKERHKLPSPPAVMTKVIHILNDPDFNVRDLSRVITDDPALASKTLSLSRSPRYAQRLQPQTVHQAILVLGLQTLRNIVVATAAKSFISRTNKISERIWSHSLAAALAGRIVAKRVGFADPEQAFLVGLLHDVGEMVLFNSDPRSFEELVEEAQRAQISIAKKEAEHYGFDHTAVGVALLEFWHIDDQVSDAVLHHHESEANAAGSLAAIIDMADYLCAEAELGFYAEFPVANAEMVRACGCADDESLRALVQEVREAFDQESLLFKEA
jgi:putative nucleotidyltransferase with HDIG domain